MVSITSKWQESNPKLHNNFPDICSVHCQTLSNPLAKAHKQPWNPGQQQFLRKLCVVLVPDTPQHCLQNLISGKHLQKSDLFLRKNLISQSCGIICQDHQHPPLQHLQLHLCRVRVWKGEFHMQKFQGQALPGSVCRCIFKPLLLHLIFPLNAGLAFISFTTCSSHSYHKSVA